MGPQLARTQLLSVIQRQGFVMIWILAKLEQFVWRWKDLTIQINDADTIFWPRFSKKTKCKPALKTTEWCSLTNWRPHANIEAFLSTTKNWAKMSHATVSYKTPHIIILFHKHYFYLPILSFTFPDLSVYFVQTRILKLIMRKWTKKEGQR